MRSRKPLRNCADLTFYSIDASTGRPRTPVLYIDTAKVSTIESTAETTYAEGGRGNGRLIAWDFGKEITLSIEDAVFSPKSLAIMFGEGRIDHQVKGNDGDLTVTEDAKSLYRTLILSKADVLASIEKQTTKTLANGVTALIKAALGDKVIVDDTYFTYTAADSQPGASTYALTVTYTAGEGTAAGTLSVAYKDTDLGASYTDEKFFVSFYINPKNAYQINVGPDSFPGTYYITADTYVRSEGDGEDRFFQIIIPKGKVTSENTLTMEADGDPTVFNMNVDVLRATVGGANVMMQLVQYDFDSTTGDGDTGVNLDRRIATSGDIE